MGLIGYRTVLLMAATFGGILKNNLAAKKKPGISWIVTVMPVTLLSFTDFSYKTSAGFQGRFRVHRDAPAT
jgi:hypothetical protein